ncbi:DUF309 domain-containing protein [Haliangium sp.]|uniref:DUF309 domain-containing protein n=1 Tax=Haliangium sp. TaxID=2663208 RepID=UPI003D137195
MSESRPPRYLPAWPLPERAYLPGRDPRPSASAASTVPDAPLPAADAEPAVWRRHPVFLCAVDRYNHGFPWEAHEAWELLWRRAAPGSTVHHLLQALIQCAATVVHVRAGRTAGVRAVSARALAHLDAVIADAGQPGWHRGRFMGIDVAGFRSVFHAYAGSDEPLGDGPAIELSEPDPASAG